MEVSDVGEKNTLPLLSCIEKLIAATFLNHAKCLCDNASTRMLLNIGLLINWKIISPWCCGSNIRDFKGIMGRLEWILWVGYIESKALLLWDNASCSLKIPPHLWTGLCELWAFWAHVEYSIQILAWPS